MNMIIYFGLDLRQLIGGLSYLLEITIAVLLFSASYRKKKFFALRFAGMLLAGILFCFGTAYLRTLLSDRPDFGFLMFRFFSYAFLSLEALLVLLVCYQEDSFELTIAWATLEASRGAFYNLYYLLVVATGHDPVNSNTVFPTGSNGLDMLIYYIFFLAAMILLSILFRKRSKALSNRHDYMVLNGICAGIVFADNLLLSCARPFESESLALATAFRCAVLFCFVFALGLLLGLLKWNRLSEELSVTEQLLLREKRYYKQSKANVEAINRTLHDLKHRLSDIENKLTSEEMDSMRQAMALYDSNIKTGNEVLDTILYEKQIYLSRNNVRLTCMADGSALRSMSPSHLYSLFDNAIDNAMEAVLKLPDPESRLVCVNVAKAGHTAEIVIYNFYDPASDASTTSKADINRHGYGLASMRAVAERYGGTMEIIKKDGIFTVSVKIPISKNSPAKTPDDAVCERDKADS